MTKSALQILEQHNIRPSIQRIEVVKYLLSNRTHPSADDLYSALQPAMPTLSRTTIYNVLKTLETGGVVRTLHLDEHTLHYDIAIEPHAHCRCSRCGCIYDIPLPQLELELPEGFRPGQVELTVQGLCPACRTADENPNS